MTDVEHLLRETLTDPRRRIESVPELYDNVRRGARKRQQRNASAATATAVVIAVVVASVAVNRGPGHRKVIPASPGTPTPTLIEPTHDSTSTQIDLGAPNFDANSVVVSPTAAFVVAGLAPMRLLKLDPATGQVVGSLYGASDTGGGLALDENNADLYLWSSAGELRQYDTSTFALKNLVYDALPVGVQIFNMVSINGQPWFTTDQGLYSVTVAHNSAVATKVPGLTNVFGLAADPAHGRILVGASGGAQVVAVDVATKRVTFAGTAIDVGKEGIAVVDGQVWVGGYGATATPRLLKLDAVSLQPTATPALNSLLGPGAIVWPGQKVLWVRHGGDTRLDCVDPRSGAVLQTWSNIQGPVSSIAGTAYAANDGALQRLTLEAACPG